MKMSNRPSSGQSILYGRQDGTAHATVSLNNCQNHLANYIAVMTNNFQVTVKGVCRIIH
jgi:hypothetical protein